MAGKLRAVEAGEKPPVKPPETLVEALAADDRRSLLVLSRAKVAAALDAGVPAHSLVRMLAELERLDSEIRRIDAVDKQEAGAEGDAAVGGADDGGEGEAFSAASL